ncbi:WD40 repeat-like protein [Conidiobolus coronatus NRRL 28638]|uniref:Ribosome biogenesis protein NSA1 n=1 Tax=Conidiobolus coronatus (strain ATCC 28846 / CBS 209.66 / NRRL 28638) TaxID=796925 RepID=A0A137PER7_CONC2|nr:WD40 repeat-like protein [Conidiobolus coronatus NRRL 28638]|eukprot:KXN73504.1 WD40 repeat-like protein [Conidiobolus coronatus NRRL 28638]
MRIITGDDIGVLKVAHVEPKLIFNQHSKKVKDEPNEPKKKQNNSANSNPLNPYGLTDNSNINVSSIGSIDKEKAISHIAWCQVPFDASQEEVKSESEDSLEEPEELENSQEKLNIASKYQAVIASRQDGTLDIISIEDRDIIQSFTIFEDQKSVKFVGVFSNENTIACCTSTGLITYLKFTDGTLDGEVDQTQYQLISNKTIELEVFKVNQEKSNVFAVGGKEYDLELYDTNTSFENPEKPEPIFKAKNVPHDSLDLRVPIWINDLTFIPTQIENHFRIALCTKHSHLRVYQTGTSQRRPFKTYEIDTKPFTSITPTPDPDHVVLTDNEGALQVYSLSTGKRVYRFIGITGRVTGVAFGEICRTFGSKATKVPTVPIIIASSLDRYVRVYKYTPENRNLIHKIYVKTRSSSILFDELSHVQDIQDLQPFLSSKQDDALWDSIASLQPSKKPKTE